MSSICYNIGYEKEQSMSKKSSQEIINEELKNVQSEKGNNDKEQLDLIKEYENRIEEMKKTIEQLTLDNKTQSGLINDYKDVVNRLALRVANQVEQPQPEQPPMSEQDQLKEQALKKIEAINANVEKGENNE